ncbi:hypothetical protein C8A03DRAFT_17415 [Achaetomium macrosporum]|uniref:Uncharacterized protein n=1 Tax=Achaetomium macrosporum TaxID=79813 RepID=A0AAN7C6X2_9PEZI|nr:hypothetical protein C8A03DRAFT_17415 [Achaetomium macrosporum]
MVTTRLLNLLRVFAVAHLPVSLGAIQHDGFGGYGQSDRIGPYDANSTAFLNAVASSNSTGIFKIPGYDVSKPFPGTSIDGWTLSIAALDLSHPDLAVLDATHQAMIGHSLTIQAPDSLIKSAADGTKMVNADPSWGMCMWTFYPPSSRNKILWNNPTNKPLAEDGSCQGFLSDECIAGLEKWATWSAYPADPATAESDGWLFERDKGTRYNSTQDLQLFWDNQVLNFWTVVTVMVNATIDVNARYGDRGVGLPHVNCVAPNGVGTRKASAFSSANFTVQNSGADSGNGSKADDENSGAGTAGPTWSVIWAVAALLVVRGCCIW